MTAHLQAGAARADITPELGIQLAGDIGRYRPTEEIRDPLYANVLVAADSNEKVCILSLDLLSCNQEWSDRIREAAAATLGTAKKAVVLHIVQNHAAPALGHFFIRDDCPLMPAEYDWLRGGDERYNQPTMDRIIAAVREANAKLEPVTLHLGRGIDGRVAFNRRFVMRDGRGECHPPNCSPEILHCEGPTDPEVGVATFQRDDGMILAALLHHTSHPCHGYPHRYVIGDWPGAWAARMQEHCGPECVPLVVNGCCGNIHHNNHLDPQPNHDYHAMADKLMQTTKTVLQQLQPSTDVSVAWRQTSLELPLRPFPPELVEEARNLLAVHPEPMWLDDEKTRVDWDWVYACTRLDVQARYDESPVCPYEIQALRLGDLCLATLMGEPFVEAQLAIKLAAGNRPTIVAHFCNGYAGYVPTAAAIERGGYETRAGSASKFAADALDRITRASQELNDQLFAEKDS